MSSRSTALWIALFVALAIAGGAVGLLAGDDSGERAVPGAAYGRVVRAIDGDTVEILLAAKAETVRYIGVDAPETVEPGAPVQCFGRQASAFNRRMIEGRRVRLRFGAERRDRYGRLLAYVYPEGSARSASAELIARGYGRELTIAPNSAHAVAFARLERHARRHHLGLWRACGRRP